RAAAEHGADWVLVVDAERRPLGWLALADLPLDGILTGQRPSPVGRSFRPDTDSLRVALDSAVLSPAGLAVAVDADGRLLGTAAQSDIAAAIRTADDNYGRTPEDTPARSPDTPVRASEDIPGVPHGQAAAGQP